MSLAIKNRLQHDLDNMIELSCILFIPSLLYSKALITVCYILFVVLAIGKVITSKRGFGLRSDRFPLLLYGFAFLSVVLSGWNSADQSQWIHEMVIRLPILIVPLCFYFFDSIDQAFVHRIHCWLILVLTVAAIPVILTYAMSVDHWAAEIGMGKSIPTPIEHVKYSMFNAYGVISALILYIFHRDALKVWVSRLLLIAALFLAIYMHFLAVRTGLVIMYISVFVLLIIHFWNQRSLAKLILSTLLIGAFGLALLKVSPTLKSKLAYMNYDWEMYKAEQGDLYSDSERLQSLKIGCAIFEDNLLFGVGAGDLKSECEKVYQDRGRDNFSRYPHNQFLYVLAGTGLVGFILFLVGFYGPYISLGWKSSYLLSFLYLNYSLSFLVENSMERSMSMGLFIVIASMIISVHTYKKEPIESNELSR